MFGVQFYHALTKKYVMAFGNLFNDIYISRTDANGVTQFIKVPLTYAPKDKMLHIIQSDPANDKEAAVVLPQIAFEIKALTYANERKKNTLNNIVRKDHTAPNKLLRMYQTVPWDIHFEVYIFVKNTEDGTKIVEQILPYFKPNWDMTLNIIPEFDVKLDTPVVIENPMIEDKYDGQFTERRALMWTIPFKMKVEYFGPIRSKPIIKFSKQQFYFGDVADPSLMVGFINTEPGLTANGEPTSVATDSVDPNVIEVDDDFGFVITSSGLVLNE